MEHNFARPNQRIMDKSWTREPDRLSEKYEKGVQSFLMFAIRFAKQNDNMIQCPCGYCNNNIRKSFHEVWKDLYEHGFSFSYSFVQWILHGEADHEQGGVDNNVGDDSHRMHELNGGLDELVNDVEAMHEEDNETESLKKLRENAMCELYPGCGKSLLKVVTELLNIKVMNKWSNKSFEALLVLLKGVLPVDNMLPVSYYAAKKFLDEIGTGFNEIDVCKNDCALFYKDNESLENCPVCGESRWEFDDGKGNRIPHKILRHFPLKPRLQRMFMSSEVAYDMQWHDSNRDAQARKDEEGVMRHPADTPAWKHFDNLYPEVAGDKRNVKFGLATDGFTPWSDMGNPYSLWPVILIPYNLPSHMFMKQEFQIMSLLIPGPRSPGKDLDVYLRPLIDELLELWEPGVEIYDAYAKERFQLHASLLWTISDFPAYGSLSGWVTQGKMACPVCFDETRSVPLRSKTGFLGHRCFLDENHSWRKDRKSFNGRTEHRPRPKQLSGTEVHEWQQRVMYMFDGPGKHPSKKKRKRSPEEANWVKLSIFFELPYWEHLLIRHNLDPMHVEKNICDNVLGTMFDVPGKTKDTVKAREDLRDLGIREELQMKVRSSDGKPLKPVACFKLSPDEKNGFCEFLKSVKVPDGYAANISRCIKEKKICGLKSHDCHVLLQRLIPIGIRGYLNKEVTGALFELGNFFKELCSKTLRVDDIVKLERNIPLILCKLEKIFPPAFFTVMVHLCVHLPEQARIAGPVHPRWMYPIERMMGALKRFVRNRAHPEASIAEAYIVNELLTFISMYLTEVTTKFNQRSRNYDGTPSEKEDLTVFSMRVRPFGHLKRNLVKETIWLGEEELRNAHIFILRNCEEVDEYYELFMAETRGLTVEESSNLDVNDVDMKQFAEWFKNHINVLHHNKEVEVSEGLWALANGPFDMTNYYNGCIVNEVRFHTKDHELRRVTQNSGLVVEGDQNNEMKDFYGYLDGVVELVYLGGRKVVLFKCEWFDTSKRTGNRKTIDNDKHFISIDIRSRWYKNDPFVLPISVQQVFYLNDTKLGENWKVVQRVQHRHLWDLPANDVVEEQESGGYATQTPMQQYQSGGVTVIDDDLDDEVDLVRKDVEPDEIPMDEFNKIRHLQHSVDPAGFDDENEFDIDDMVDSEHFIDELEPGYFDESEPDEEETRETCDGEDESSIATKRKKRKCKCHL